MSTSQYQLLSHVLTAFLAEETTIELNLPFVLEIIISHQLLTYSPSEENAEEAAVFRKWTVRLNALLQSKHVAVKCAAITLIRETCEQSSMLLVANIQTWSAQLLGLVLKTEAVIVQKEAIKTLSFIYQYTADKPELHREITSPNMSRFNSALLSLSQNRELLATALVALTINMEFFPSASRHAVDNCQKICLSHMDGTTYIDEDTVKAITRCLASLYQANLKANMVDQWKKTLLQVIGSVHASLDRLFDTVDEEFERFGALEGFSYSPLSVDYREAFPVLMRRVHMLEKCITVFTSTKTSIAVPMPVTHLLDLVCRIYNVYEGSLMREFKEKAEFNSLLSFLPSLHLGANKVLASIFYGSGQEMIRYSKLFSRLLLRLLSDYKQKSAIAKPLYSILLEDVKLTEAKQTNVMAPSHGNKSGKKRRLEITNSDALTVTSTLSAADSGIQLAALKVLQDLITTYGFSMENTMRSSIDSVLLTTILQITQMIETSNESLLLAKQGLYHCLLASVMHPIETQASILPHAMRIFTAGVNEQTQQLRAICLHGLSVCDLIIHPRLPPIQRAPVQPSSVTLLTTESHQTPTITPQPVISKVTKQEKAFGSAIVGSATEDEQKQTMLDTRVLQHAHTKELSTVSSSVQLEDPSSTDTHDVESGFSWNAVKKTNESITTLSLLDKSSTPNMNETAVNSIVISEKTTNVSSKTTNSSIVEEIAQNKPFNPILQSNISYSCDTIDEDDIMEIPEIDLAGPDSDEEN
ncbi:rRNA processing/ribosome biogenesis-domain-containing protein [Spinellus fusiger]|nr:rRNA processing/ribosome biogenesis-domain-containing protein [Spinellus fusiger]